MPRDKSNVFNRPDLNGPNKSFLGYYFPSNERWLRHSNINLHDRYSRYILSLKNSNHFAIDYFYERIEIRLTNNEFVIVVVPSHTEGFNESGIGILARKISEKHSNITDGTRCLFRHRTIQALNRGGNRDKSVHLDSISVINEGLIKDQHVLLLDDIFTTGNSLDACKELLERAGAKTVKCYVLGKTMHDNIGHPENDRLNEILAQSIKPNSNNEF